MMKQVILTGLRANNDLTLGNYFGGMLPIIDMAKNRSSDYQINMFIPDLHSFTTPIDHTALYEQILQTARIFVAAGLPLEDENLYMYRQSYIPAHSELTWILNCFTGIGQLGRMTQFKDKSANAVEVSAGLFDYPVLMASDILLYNASYVPVGDDQTQHLEFTRDIAERMNSKFGDILTVPEPTVRQNAFFEKEEGLRIKDLLDPSKKMSKSDETGKGVIFLSDDPDNAAKKIMSATTDDKANVAYDKINQPGIANLLEIFALLREVSVKVVADEFAGETRYGDFKKIVAEEVRQFLVGFQAKLATIDDAEVIAKLEMSESAMRLQANRTLLSLQKAIGLRPLI